MSKISLSPSIQRVVFSGLGLLLGTLCLLAPYWEIAEIAGYVGGLLVWAAILEIAHGFKRADVPARMSAWVSGAITLVIGTLMINAKLFHSEALINFILSLFVLDSLRYVYLFYRSYRKGAVAWGVLLAGLGNAAIAILMIVFRGKGAEWLISACGALRIFGTVYSMYTSRIGTVETAVEDVVDNLGLRGNAALEALARKLDEEDSQRSAVDRGWIATFLMILFFIHLGRMGLDQSASGVLSPLVAVIGDAFIAVVFAFGLIAPLRTIFRTATGIFVRALWKWVQKVPRTEWRWFSLRRPAMAWLTYTLGVSISLRKSSYSFLTAIRNGIRIGLPFAALLAAIVPVLGMSWYFDTENWASGVWDGYASSRAERWRTAMVGATAARVDEEAFRLRPEGLSDTADFSFVVIGDPGEGDPSQHVLKDQILAVSNKSDVRFVVISSDVVYPSGAMKDYERKFFLPFKGVKKPIYAIPGNHDWYDALNGFAATFYTPDAARLSIEARVKSDLKLSTTTAGMIDRLVRQASSLRKEYQLTTGFQTAPFFQVATDFFVLLTIDTGVLRRVDATQLAWIKAVLEASKGKFVMAVLGHPFYAIGEYQGNLNPDFKALHDLLRSYRVPLVMAGDTHDLEYYKELPQSNNGHVMHHFVNGGGGAYLSIGAAMAPAGSRPSEDWAVFPSREPLFQKIDSLTPRWKYPAWVWLKEYNGYPFSAEWLSAAFDYNQAPYFQSFMEIKVESSQKRIRLIPYGIHGQLRWSDFDYGGGGKPEPARDSDLAEWVLPLRAQSR